MDQLPPFPLAISIPPEPKSETGFHQSEARLFMQRVEIGSPVTFDTGTDITEAWSPPTAGSKALEVMESLGIRRSQEPPSQDSPEELGKDPFYRLLEKFVVHWVEGEQSRAETPLGTEETPSLSKLKSALDQLQAMLAEARAEFPDVAGREQSWRAFQKLVSHDLWQAVEDLDDDPSRQELAEALDAAVSALQAFQLRDKHLSVIDLHLERLAADRVTENDVDRCEKAWEATGIDTIPRLGEAFEEWLRLSSADPDDDD